MIFDGFVIVHKDKGMISNWEEYNLIWKLTREFTISEVVTEQKRLQKEENENPGFEK